MCCGGGLVVSNLVFYSDDPSSKTKLISRMFLWYKNTKRNEKEAEFGLLKTALTYHSTMMTPPPPSLDSELLSWNEESAIEVVTFCFLQPAATAADDKPKSNHNWS